MNVHYESHTLAPPPHPFNLCCEVFPICSVSDTKEKIKDIRTHKQNTHMHKDRRPGLMCHEGSSRTQQGRRRISSVLEAGGKGARVCV